ncbi:MAG: DUF6088 family protein [Planctomycetota bacterium]
MVKQREKIEQRLKKMGKGWAFSRKDLRDIAPSGAAGVVLSRLVACGTIRRIGLGLYDYPRQSKLIGALVSPDIDQAARAIARKHRWTIAPSGAAAANMLGLSQQVPAKIVYLSDGPSRQLQVGRQVISFRHASPKDLRMEHYSSRLIAQALRFLGKDSIDDKVLGALRRVVPRKDRGRFLKDAQYGTDWILDVAQEIAREDEADCDQDRSHLR